MPPLLQKLPGKADGGEGGSVFVSVVLLFFIFYFLANQKIASSWKKCVLGHPIARATSYCLLPNKF